jgi:predicted RNase H-like nuclease
MHIDEGALFVGVDLAWGEGTDSRAANESGFVALNVKGEVVDAGWPVGVSQTLDRIESVSRGRANAVLFVDAPLVITNPSGQRECERQVGQRYGRWRVSANSTNTASKRQAGVLLLAHLEQTGWHYMSGHDGPQRTGRVVSECYPYTTIVGVEELGYSAEDKRPVYKRKPRGMTTADFRPRRAANCDDLLQRMANLRDAEPPLILASNDETRNLLDAQSPTDDDKLYKHREDLLDAALCAWTALLWTTRGFERCQVLGDAGTTGARIASIIAPARPEQRP